MVRLRRAIPVLALGLWLLPAGDAQALRGDDEAMNPDLAKASKLMDKGRFAEALPLLQTAIAAEPKNADILNALGYSHRKLGAVEPALNYYQKALAVEPAHRGANEYLGELYLELGELSKAEERLGVLDKACFFGCEEYDELKEAIKAFKAKSGS